MLERLPHAALAIALSAWVAEARAEPALLYPTMLETRTPEGLVLERAAPGDVRATAKWARRLDRVLAEAAQDLGLTLDLSERQPKLSALEETALVERAAGGAWVVSPRLGSDGGSLRIRIVAVPPGSRVLLVRSHSVEERDAEVRSLVMLRDLIEAGRHEPAESEARAAPEPRTARPARSAGRPALALNAAAFSGFVGYSIQVASGSSDARLTYPLIALGTGIGLGGSMIVADEWDVGIGDAWYLSAGAWWPLASGLLLADGYDVEPTGDRYAYGLVGAATGVTLATVSLGFEGMGDGGAALAHSGGAFGLLLGGLGEWGVEGSLDRTPSRGMGFGAGAGVLVAGTLATQIDVAPSRVLLVDLGAMLGALTGAAAASPLAFGESETEGKNRLFVVSTAAGALGGAAIAFLTTRPSAAAQAGSSRRVSARPRALPWAGSFVGPGGSRALGAGVLGAW
jgi:hypothetical protein